MRNAKCRFMSERGVLSQILPWMFLWGLATLTLFYITIDLGYLGNNDNISVQLQENWSFYIGYGIFISILLAIIILFVHCNI